MGSGPRGLQEPLRLKATYGKVNGFYGNVDGRIDFTISWDEPKITARFIGTIGPDGIASGTSIGPEVPINLWKQGPWVSTTKFECTDAATQGPPPEKKALQGPTVTTDTGLTGVTFRVSLTAAVSHPSAPIRRKASSSSPCLPMPPSMCSFQPFGNSVTGPAITCDNGTSANTTVFY